MLQENLVVLNKENERKERKKEKPIVQLVLVKINRRVLDGRKKEEGEIYCSTGFSEKREKEEFSMIVSCKIIVRELIRKTKS